MKSLFENEESICNNPIITVVVCCFNGSAFLPGMFESLLAQEFKMFEVIFIDDGSTDETSTIANKYLNDLSNSKYFKQENKGLNASRNQGFKFASPESKYVIFLDADDLFDTKLLKLLFYEIEKDEKIAGVYCDYMKFDSNNNKYNENYGYFYQYKFGLPNINKNRRELFFIDIFSFNHKMIEAAILMRKEAFLIAGGWDEINFPKGQTYGESVPLLLSLKKYGTVKFLNHKLYLYRQHSNQITVINNYKSDVVTKVFNSFFESEFSVIEKKKMLLFLNLTNKLIKFRGNWKFMFKNKSINFFFDALYFLLYFIQYNLFLFLNKNFLNKKILV